ncbi:MAG: hypothetical protein HYR96_10325 [Deltaproteobacteria bacterium]|nr:hypothetical protein [Deltaproteobacteria bacterium]MBI3295626.1 hypothetical protein [Deltaproteobacteria bacterium]
MKSLTLMTVCFALVGALAFGQKVSPKEASKRIARVVNVASRLAESGVADHKVEPGTNVKAMLYELALQTEYVTSEEEFSWVGDSNDAWEADSTNWGETTMKGAYHYIVDEPDQFSDLEKKEQQKFKKAAKATKKVWRDLLGTGVRFGVAPMGAVQCGVTFAALAIIDPHTGKTYLFAREGSGC